MCGENKGADQLCSYCTADLRLCFRIYKLLVFSFTGSISVFDPKRFKTNKSTNNKHG